MLIAAAVVVVAAVVVLVVTRPWSGDGGSGHPQAGRPASTGPSNGTIEVVLTPDVTAAQTDAIRKDLQSAAGVLSLQYVSPAMAGSLPPALVPDPPSPFFFVRVSGAQGAAAVRRIATGRPGVSAVKG